MARPHPALIDLVAGRSLPSVSVAEMDALVTSAIEHRVTGLLWTEVLEGRVSASPAQVRYLAQEDLRSRAHNFRLWHVLGEATERLHEIGVEIAVVKGITAEARWYTRTGERLCTDLDILLAPNDVRRIDEVICVIEPTHPLRGALAALATSGALQSIDLNLRGIELDVHADLLKVEIPVRQSERLWKRRVYAAGPSGNGTASLDPEISLMHFLLHLNKDRFSLLHGYADIVRILAQEDVDWDFFVQFVDAEGLLTHVTAALWAVVTDLHLPSPPIPPPTGPRAALWAYLWPPSRRLLGHAGLVGSAHRQYWIPLSARGRFLEALRWTFRRRIFPAAELVPIYYPDTKGPYLLRLLVGRSRVRTTRHVEMRRHERRRHQ